MKVGIVSDTHDNGGIVERAVGTFEQEDVDAVIHCGDIVAPFSATPFESGFDFYAVRGNNDGEWALERTVGGFGTYLGEMGELTLGDVEFAVYHGTSEPIVDALLECGTYDYVCRGHTHERINERRGETVHLNPGGIPIPDAPEDPAAIVLDTETGDVEFHDLG
ncbi:metallophosphoesterase [Halapricum hydrolyticum]|uniref:Phosphoesterase n=1 Tax=Halapricum hydrolyticum TaxID=2979991 RepID=A0AAE3IFX2_9EURY|nr:metallophosphoesterase [Halapricum hydrolyticum]MCU4718873.1 metallophosphoesterase [Halapricum hydrolyticum]MCU4727849.1 metallophosphoesterase [Halapricum hydrolyticum]